MHHLFHMKMLRRASVILRVVLLLVVWNGPLPYCHCHGTLQSVTFENASWLFKHLKSHHGDTMLYADTTFGWHLHFRSPAPWEDNQESSTNCYSPCQPVLGSNAVPHSEPRIIAYVCDLVHSESRPQLVEREFAANPFYENYAAALPLPLRFGVSRC